MRVRSIYEEDFINYKRPSMVIITCFCNGKCYKDLNLDKSICHNEALMHEQIVSMDNAKIIQRYVNNSLTSAVVFSGLEPFEQYDEMIELIRAFREHTEDAIVIYTGYNKSELEERWLNELANQRNIIIKYGRYIPGDGKHFDKILGVCLASNNQYAEQL